MSEVRIAAEPRSEFGKGGARRTRRAGKVPGVIYGHGRDPVHVALPGHELMLALKAPNVLLSLDYDGGTELVLPKQVQRDPIRGFLQHVDLVIVRRGEQVTVDVPLVFVGDAVPDALVNHELNTLSVRAEATHIPTSVEISIAGLAVGGRVTAGEIALPDGVSLAIEADHVVVSILAAPSAAQVEADLAGAEADAGIERETPAETAGATAAEPQS
ncbi:MAG TPA: 50S ribosomal protein L25/general stress protein Ctc [Mycobacteriales bacterium]|nr:50S ribosomal protein L25/general stress protein Ctc [Mycobacteriales bacterium]